MAKFLFTLGLAIFQVAHLVSGVEIEDLFTVQSGSNNGGCSDYTGVLEGWHQESIDSLGNSVNAIDAHYNKKTPEGELVRSALFTYFNIPIPKNIDESRKPKGLPNEISKKLKDLQDWFEGEPKNIPKADTYLFCSGEFLVEKNPTDTALDYDGDIIMKNNEPVTIAEVPAYAKDLEGGKVPWWAGDRTDINGYYITDADSGGKYCDQDNLGQTAFIQALELRDGSPAPQRRKKTTVILCPKAFNNIERPEEYEGAVGDIKDGDTLEDVVPRSATFLHEAFHIFFGAGSSGMLQGNQEFYGLAKCIELAKIDKVKSRRNPENYVYLVAALHYYFGTEDDGITKNWNFLEEPGNAKLRS